MNVVLDTNVVVSAIFWPGESRDVLVLWARRRFQMALSVEIFEEYCYAARKVARNVRSVNPEPWLDWIESNAKLYEPTPLGKQRSRDPDDDPLLACCLASGSKLLISKDKDLLSLGKPFGVEVLTPREFLPRMR